MPAAMVCPPVRSMNRPVRQMDAQNSIKKHGNQENIQSLMTDYNLQYSFVHKFSKFTFFQLLPFSP
jgi:hypothetical protein